MEEGAETAAVEIGEVFAVAEAEEIVVVLGIVVDSEVDEVVREEVVVERQSKYSGMYLRTKIANASSYFMIGTQVALPLCQINRL